MKKFFRKTLALALALTLVFTLAACGKKTADNQGEPTPTAEPTSTPTPTPIPTHAPVDLDMFGIDFLPDNAVDASQQILGFPGDTVLFTVNGTGVTAQEYLYWLGYMTSYYGMMFSYYGYGELNFEEVVGENGETLDQELKESAYQNSLILAVIPELVARYCITFTDADIAELVQMRETSIENAGGLEYYALELQAMGINDTTAFKTDVTSALFSNLQETYVAGLTAQEVADFAREEGYLRAKHILLLTTDMITGAPYDDATVAQQRATAEDILAQLQADPSRFDDLMNEYSEDTGLSTNPDGYFFGPGEMVESFESGTAALEIGEISGIIESEYGYHIIQRLDPDCEEAREKVFDAMLQAYVEAAVVEKKAEYDSFTTREYYEALQEFQAGLDIPPIEEDASNATLEPQTNPN